MADDPQDVEVRIGVDASAVAPGAATTKASIQSIADSVATLAAQSAAQTKAITAGFDQMAAASSRVQKQIKADVEEEEASLLGLISTVHEGVESFNEFKASLSEIAEVYLAAFAVERVVDFAKEMGEAGEQTEHTAQRLGMATGQVQQLSAAFIEMGVAPDRGVQAMGRLDKAFAAAREGSKQQSEAFKELGVDITQNYTQAQLLGSVMDGFKEMANGPQKTAVAMELLGRAGAQMIPFLNLGSQGLEEINERTAQYGVVNEEAVEKAAQLGSAFNENKVAMQGFGNVMSDALAPAFTAVVQGVNGLIAGFVQSYNQGGIVKTMMDAITATFNVLGEIVNVVGDVIGTFFSAMSGDANTGASALKAVQVAFILIGDAVAIFGAAAKAVFQSVGALIDQAEIAVNALGRVMMDALSGQWSKIGADTQKGFADIAARSHEAATQIGADWTKLQDQLAHMGDARPKEQPKPSGEGEDGDTSGLAGAAKAKAESRVAAWKEALQEQLEAENNYFGDSKAEELAYWESKLALTTEKSKEWYAVEHEIYTLKKADAQQSLNDQIATYSAEIAAAKGNYAQQLTLEQQKVAAIGAAYGQQSKQYQDALREMENMERAHQQELLQIATAGIQARAKAEEDLVAVDKQLASIRLQSERSTEAMLAATGRESKAKASADDAVYAAQEVAQEEATANAVYEIKLKALQAELALDNQTPEHKAAIDKQIEQLEAAHQAQMVQLNAAGALKVQQAQDKAAEESYQAWDQSFQKIGSEGTSIFNGLITSQMTWAQAFNKICMDVLGYFENMGVKMVASWLAKLAAKKAAATADAAAENTITATQQAAGLTADKVAAISQITTDAAVAAAGAFAATASIPIIGPGLAPAAAAAAYADVEAFAGLASAAGGWGDIPQDQIAQVHKNEMILPAPIASGVRDAISATGTLGSGGGGSSGGSGGAPTLNIYALDGQSVYNVLTQNSGQVAMALQGIAQNGHFSGMNT